MTEFIQGFGKGFKAFGHNIALIVNTVLLLIVYIIGTGITAVYARFAKKSFLEIELQDKSYWSKLNLKKKDLKEYLRQF